MIAFRWMYSMEMSTESARQEQTMHPLWKESVYAISTLLYLTLLFRYTFPSDPHRGVIDLTAEDRPFYFNGYSGELSLQFPRAERKFKGGILAYVMCIHIIQCRH